ncbi:MAG: UBP-type zinc finger domain-containing protein [Bacteroidota bacterium]|nr:UBP-type zinc finger domain-containing protein [Bacteroidota bacterium]
MDSDPICDHLRDLTKLKQPKADVCEECIKTGDEWVHLRTCQSCGATLCCDSSPNRHMTKHYQASGHPVIISAQPGERWIFCYIDNVMADY